MWANMSKPIKKNNMNRLMWFPKMLCPPGVVNLLIRWRHQDRWAYSFVFNMGTEKPSLLECRETDKGPKYDYVGQPLLDKDWEWAVLPTNDEWDELMENKGYMYRERVSQPT